MIKKKLRIMGTYGVPGNHGGFETFAEDLSLYLVRRGWDVEVYCQVNSRSGIFLDKWCGVTRINVPVRGGGALAAAIFDLKSVVHSLSERSAILTLGYNTAILNGLHRVLGIPNVINMDGIEWRRAKWSFSFKVWFYINEILACWFGSRLVADHPGIALHLRAKANSKKIVMIPYASARVRSCDESMLLEYSLKKNEYCILIARPEPENSILQIVRSFSSRKRNFKLVVLGKYSSESVYQAEVLNVASDEVVFFGAIYDKKIVQALRYYARFYVHGHTVGGTNPSLVEAMGVGSAVLAHDNHFNRWVTGEKAAYFKSEEDCENELSRLIMDDSLVTQLQQAMAARHEEEFTFEKVLPAYENLILSLIS